MEGKAPMTNETITRREAREPPTGVGEVIAIDFLDHTKDPNSYNSTLLFTNRASSYVFNIYLKDRKEYTLIRAFDYFRE